MSKQTGEYHSGDKSLMEEELDQVTKTFSQPDKLNSAIIPFEKRNMEPVG